MQETRVMRSRDSFAASASGPAAGQLPSGHSHPAQRGRSSNTGSSVFTKRRWSILANTRRRDTTGGTQRITEADACMILGRPRMRSAACQLQTNHPSQAPQRPRPVGILQLTSALTSAAAARRSPRGSPPPWHLPVCTSPSAAAPAACGRSTSASSPKALGSAARCRPYSRSLARGTC